MTTVAYMEDGHSVSLTTEIGGGGEGVIYASPSDPLQCAKIYTKPILPETLKKLSLMVSNPPPDPTYKVRMHRSICWPTALLYKSPSKNALAGFFMPKLDLKIYRKALLVIDHKDRTATFGGGFTWKHLVTAAANIASAVAAIHEQGYCIGDLNESNILIAPNALISLIDCDSFQVPDSAAGKTYRSPVGKPEYLAPELSGKHLPDVDRTIASDSFALAVLLFQLLMDGTHPYQAKGRLVENASSTDAKILLGHFPYVMRGKEIAPPDHAPPFELLHPEIRRLFERCFTRGHASPDQRPTAREWYGVLRNLEGTFHQCGANPNHLYFDHLRSCPWCEIEARRGRDPFPSPIGQQVALDNSANLLDSLEKRLEYLHPYVVMAFADGILTIEEESQLGAFGKKLQIPAKEIEKLIQIEAAKVHGKRGKTLGSPEITLSQTRFEFNNIRRGTQLSGRYTITNTGGGTLSGTIKANMPWVALPQGTIDGARHIQEHTFYLDTSKLTIGTRNRATIEIVSNAGTVRIDVSVAVEMESAALSRFEASVMAIGDFLAHPTASWAVAAGLTAIGVIVLLLLYAVVPSVRRETTPPPENKVTIIAPTVGWSVALMMPPDFIQKRLKIAWDGNIVAQDDDGNVFNVRVGAGLVGRTKTSVRWLRFRSTMRHPVTMYASSPFPASQCPIITFNPAEPQKRSAKKPQGIPKSKTIEELTARNIRGDSGSSTGGSPIVQRDTSVHTLSPGEPPDNSTADSVPSEPHSFKLTPDSPVGQGSATIVGPGNGVQNFNLYYIDTRDFAGGGILEIELKISADSATDGSFDLFPSNVPIPTTGMPSGALVGRHDVRKGTSTRFEYRFTFGQVFVLGVEGNWFSPKGAKGLVQFRVSVRR